jgi:hypothetical protein
MPPPVSRSYLQTLKATKQEEKRLEMIRQCVNKIYTYAIQTAEITTNTFYSFDINPHHPRSHFGQEPYTDGEHKFYKDNMSDILTGLQVLFQDCSVKFTKMCTGNDGKRYDISTLDEKMLPFVNQKQIFECIVIDWS